MSKTLKQQAVSGAFWTFVQQFSVQIISFVVQIILARLLLPEVFGLIAMLQIFISIGQMLMDSGMTSSLIRTKDPDQLDYSTVFITNMLISVLAYIIIFLGAPLVATFYNQDILKSILRVYALTFVIRALVAVHVAKLTKEMDFKTQMKLQIPSTFIGGVVGVGMAYMDFGVWSLVWYNLTQTIAFTIQNWWFIKWRPSFVFNKEKFKYHFNFGYKLTLSGLLDTIYRNIYTIVIGKAYTPTIVGYFNQANLTQKLPISQISAVMGKVTYPLFANIKGDDSLRRAYKSAMKLQFLIVVPVMMILIVIGRELFLFLFGEKWLPAVLYFQILAISAMTQPLSAYNLNILKVKGRSDLLLKLELIKKSFGIIAVFIALPFGIMTLIVSYVVVNFINTFINMFFSGKFIGYPVWAQVKDCGLIFIFGAIASFFAYFMRIMVLHQSAILIMICAGLVFLIIYGSLIFLFEKGSVHLVRKVLKK